MLLKDRTINFFNEFQIKCFGSIIIYFLSVCLPPLLLCDTILLSCCVASSTISKISPVTANSFFLKFVFISDVSLLLMLFIGVEVKSINKISHSIWIVYFGRSFSIDFWSYLPRERCLKGFRSQSMLISSSKS